VANWWFWTPVDAAGEDVSGELVGPVAERMGRPFKPSRMVRVRALPRTRSAKFLRGAVCVVAIGADPGDLLGAENPEALEVLRRRARGAALTAVCSSRWPRTRPVYARKPVSAPPAHRR
jgi:acetyl-CoA synthetase